MRVIINYYVWEVAEQEINQCSHDVTDYFKSRHYASNV